jgi:hypothetical protein
MFYGIMVEFARQLERELMESTELLEKERVAHGQTQRLLHAMQPECKWTEDADGNWFTGCGEAHVFYTGTPMNNGYRWCPYCGKKVAEVKQA